MAHDVVTFLTWAAEPNLEERHRIGFKVILFLVIVDRRLLRRQAQDLGQPHCTRRGEGAGRAAAMTGPVIGIIGGSGLYQIDGLSEMSSGDGSRARSAETSDEFCFGTLDGQPVVFLPRHGRGHVLPPSAINFRANIDALKRCGVTDILSLSAVGSLREDLAPGDFVVDRPVHRPHLRAREELFRTGLRRACVDGAPGLRPDRRCAGRSAAPHAGIALKRGGTYLVMEGPQFSTLAESELYRSWGCDVIGMTNMPEAKLAREAEICYATVAMVTDYDCWHPGPRRRDGRDDRRVLLANADKARALVKQRRAAAGGPRRGRAGRAASAPSTMR